MLSEGTLAPSFALPDKNGELIRLSDYLGRRIILYFYPKDNTPGCSRQACAYAGAYSAFRDLDAVVIGVSRDSMESHRRFAEKYNLPFILVSDPDRLAIEAYGVWQEKKLYGKLSYGVVRTTYIISPEGRIEKVFPKVKPDTDPATVLEYIKATEKENK